MSVRIFCYFNLLNVEYLVDLFDNCVQHLALERPENDGLVLDRIHNESLAGLNDSRTDHIDCGDGNDESVFAGASALHFGVQFLFDRFHQLGSEILGMEEDFVLERDLARKSGWMLVYVDIYSFFNGLLTW